jgi:steroid 5-alpha reductase family enzyme
MAFSPMFILYVVIVFSFLVTSYFMFKPRGEELVHKIFFCLAVALSILVTVVDATSIPTSMQGQIIVAWCGLVFTALGIVVRTVKGKTNAFANILVMLTTVYGVAGYFILA